MKTLILIIITMTACLLIASCCKKLFPNENLTLQRQNYTGKELKIDGYYYFHDSDGYTLVSFLYKNGIIFSTRAYLFLDLDVVEKQMINDYESLRKEKTRWGVFKITDNRIEYERWVSPTEGITTSKSSGYIENDTTFRITEHFFSYNKKTYSVNETWHFKQFDHKPDSTNNYIK